jgi:hypothetical protein
LSASKTTFVLKWASWMRRMGFAIVGHFVVAR